MDSLSEGTQEKMRELRELTANILVLRGFEVTHVKTGAAYFELGEVIDCTADSNCRKMTLYMNPDKMLFVRDSNEFNQKFARGVRSGD